MLTAPREYLVTYYRANDCTAFVVRVVARSRRAARRWVRAEWLDVVAVTASRVDSRIKTAGEGPR